MDNSVVEEFYMKYIDNPEYCMLIDRTELMAFRKSLDGSIVQRVTCEQEKKGGNNG